MGEPLKICYAASEALPFVKTGGLADVSSALPRELQRRGQDARLFLPFYSAIDRKSADFQRVDFAQNVPIEMGSRSYAFSLWTTKFPGTEQSLYLIDCPDLYQRSRLYTSDADEPQRFALFDRAVIESCQRMGWAPDVFHCNDWHTALIPFLLRTVYEWDELFTRSKSLVTIHNLGYQGIFPADAVHELGLGAWSHLFDQDDLKAGRVNFLRSGLLYADVISTVSPTYAREIQTEAYGMGLERLLRARNESLIGILNGVDYAEWSPDSDPFIPHSYSRKKPEGKKKNKRHLLQRAGFASDTGPPLLGIVSRLAHHKGFDLCFDVLPDVLAHTDLRLTVLGTGESKYEEFFRYLEQRFPGQAAYHGAYHNELAHVIEAASDMFLMPSRYEPCGLNQMFSQRYGTIPIVRKTGGLADSVRPFDAASGEGTGILFDHFDADGLRWAMDRALTLYRNGDAWRRLMDNAMAADYSWQVQAQWYVDVYSALAAR